MIYIFATNQITIWKVQRDLINAEKSLGNIADATLIKYKHHEYHVTMTFRSKCACVEDWEKKKSQVQSAINYMIFGISHAHDDHGEIIIKALKGCRQNNMGSLYDDEF